jgi:hypothetical protein
MRLYNQRLAALARKRRAAGIYGRGNLDRRLLLRAGFAPGLSALRITRAGLWEWAKLEAQSFFLKPRPAPPPATVPAASTPEPSAAREIDLAEENPPLQPVGTA